MKKLRVSGFPPIVSKDEIIRVFGKYGTIKEVKKAFGAGIAYVYMPYDYQASKAVKELNRGFPLISSKERTRSRQ